MKKILFVEDDRFIREMITEKITAEGYKVVSVVSADAAFYELENHKISLILLDLELPTMHGDDFLQLLRKHGDLKHTPVIIYSNNNEPKMKEKCMKLGARSFFVKANTDLNVLMDDIHSILD